jgi:hypothetical protein
MVGKWHLTPSNQETAAGPYDRWPLARGFERFYGFLGGDTSQWYPTSSTTTTRSSRRRDAGGGLPPHRGPGRQVDRVHRRRQAGRSRQALLPAPLLRRDARPAPRAQGVGRQVRRQFDDGWDAYRERVFAKQKELGSSPPTRAVAARSRRPRLGRPVPSRRAPALQPHDGGLRRLPEPHRPPPRAAARLPRVRSASSTTRSSWSSPTTAPAPRAGRPAPPTRRSSSTTRRSRWRTASPPSTRSAAQPLQPLPVGLDVGRQHAVPALEARDLPRRLHRPVHRLLAGRHQARGELRTSTPTSSTWSRPSSTCSASSRPRPIRGVTQSPLHGVSFASALDDEEAPETHRTQYFEMLGHRAIYHDGWRAVCPWPGPSFAEAGVGFGNPSAPTAHRARRHRLGAVPRGRGLRRDHEPGRRAP